MVAIGNCKACGSHTRVELLRDELCSSCAEWQPILAHVGVLLAEHERDRIRQRAERRAAWQKRQRKES